MRTIKPGDKFRVVFQVTRLANRGDIVTMQDGSTQPLLDAKDKFWARFGLDKEILVCACCGPIDWVEEPKP